MGNDHGKSDKANKNSQAKKALSKKLQTDLNQKFDKINRLMEKVMNVPIENIQYKNNLNENYQFILNFLVEEYGKFKKAKQFMLERPGPQFQRISACFESLFNMNKKDSLYQIFENSKIQDKITMTERKKLMIFYHISVLDKYQRALSMSDGSINQESLSKINENPKIYETNEELKKKQRKEFRNIVINIIKDDNYFVVNPTLQRFNQILEQNFYRDLKDKVNSNDKRSVQEFYIKMTKRLTKEEADFIYYCFQLITIVLTQNVQFLLQKILGKFVPSIFMGARDLYEQIFCGQIVEKLLFRTKNKILLQSAIYVSFVQTNQNKALNLQYDDRELNEFLQERCLSMQFTMNNKSLADGLLGRQQSIFNQNYLNISSNLNSNTLNNIDTNRNSTYLKNGSLAREKSPNIPEKKVQANQEQKTNANIKMIKQFANSRESFIIRNNPGVVQLRRHTFTNVSESIHQEKQNALDSIQEEVARQSNQFNESIFSEDIDKSEKLRAANNIQEIHEEEQQKNQIEQQQQQQNQTYIEVEDHLIKRSHLSAQYHHQAHQEHFQMEVTSEIRFSKRENNSSQPNFQSPSIQSQNQQSNYDQSQQIKQELQKKEQVDAQNLVEIFQSQNNQNFMDRDTFYGKDREALYNNKNRDTIYKIRSEKDRCFSQCLKNYLQEKYKKYLEEIYTLLEQCLYEQQFFKKIKKAFKFVVKLQDRFAKNSVNFQASALFIEEKDNWYQIISMVLKSYLIIKPESRWDLYYMNSLIQLVSMHVIENTHVQDFQEHLKDILMINETSESNLQSQVQTPIQYSEINNLEAFQDDINLQDPQFDMLYNNMRNSISGYQENYKKQITNQSFLDQNQQYLNENSLIKTSTQ
ncbi:hypothetical protein TTHERM_00616200 (macronuclear) [Tetrahymena thermophila SB210]|uniref:Uncharacterized protein n=1 Tax=Tetrahymena thermophila (strain SB210) TaxID=312017 RepID=I7M3W9_TETTS|nr:hypothetical protein TTHERM_00616200 [Tetrahymena thermophila SB210]EAS04445.1 hypothetical protein TTHERM_00616200 [Tetrahymena thermophila SB210]|eukprot:XP_001024690.1 hypothetical protein TTHERM_00616200 [Tetrahymena thermophila SB210]